jgi:F0F1-type ATP synthase assembly protein I
LPKQNKKLPNELAKYSGLGISMAVIIGLSAYGGTLLDDYLAMSRPVFTIIFSLIGVFAAMYITLKEFINKKE